MIKIIVKSFLWYFYFICCFLLGKISLTIYFYPLHHTINNVANFSLISMTSFLFFLLFFNFLFIFIFILRLILNSVLFVKNSDILVFKLNQTISSWKTFVNRLYSYNPFISKVIRTNQNIRTYWIFSAFHKNLCRIEIIRNKIAFL